MYAECLQTSPLTPQNSYLKFQNRVNWGVGGFPNFFCFISILIFLLLRSLCKISKLQHKPFWDKQPILAFVRPTSAFLGGYGGSPKFIFHWNLHIFVTQELMQKFKILQHPLMPFQQRRVVHWGYIPVHWGYIAGSLGLYCRFIGVILPVHWGYIAGSSGLYCRFIGVIFLKQKQWPTACCQTPSAQRRSDQYDDV